MTDFEPKLIGFMCNWCSYAGADLAGVSRYQYPTNIRIVRVMCSARVDPSLVIEMFLQGADGVFVGGCHLGDCHYIKGNYYAERRMKLAAKILAKAGLEKERMRLEWVSASEGERFSRLMKEFTEQIRGLGPSPVSGNTPNMEILEKLYIARNIAEDFRLRTLVGKDFVLTEVGNVYEKKVPQEDMERLIDEAVEEEFARCMILFATKNKPMSVKQIAEKVRLPTDKVLEHIVTLRWRDLVRLENIEGTSPMYVSQVGGV